MGVLNGLQPQAVFTYFEEICGIPHGSSDTKRISDYCVAFAKEHGLKYRQDEANNVVIWKQGTPGYENSAPVMLQGHLDMVCEKESDCEIDFSKDGLQLRLEEGIISAKGTTLGGDDGIAIAYALALLASTDIPHPPLEAVFTVDEEIGMLGAAALDCSDLKSKIMLNLDSEEEGYLLVSCAGGVTTEGHLPFNTEKASGRRVKISVHSLQGGHSGVEIDKGRGNACQLLGRVLYQIQQKTEYHLVQVEGGLKDNAIPREATAELIMDEMMVTQIQELVKDMEKIYQQELGKTDAGVKVSLDLSDSNHTCDAMTWKDTKKIICALINLPGGIQKMSFDIEGLVQTSLNLGILKTKEREVVFSFSVRSNVSTEKQELVDKITCLMESLGGTVHCYGEYPAWEYCQDSPLRDLMTEIFEQQYGKKPVIQALHAGVECGLFTGKIPGLDCVSFGPDIKDIHTPKESMEVESVNRTWKYTLEILKRLK